MVDDFAAWLAQNPELSLADFIRQYGGYGAIPREAWAEFDRAVTAWQRQRRERYGGAIGIFATTWQSARRASAAKHEQQEKDDE